MNKQDFIQSGFTVVGTETGENKLLSFLKENYPNVIRDTEINLEELKSIAGLPIDEKVNGYGLNFVGRNFARAKYATKTENELQLDKQLSKSIDTTQNLVLKGDNLDSLKILKNHYSGKIKCIYIDPPYNTTSDEFVYPDKFDKEEAEVLGLANLSESDFDRMDFSFKTKKSHNGWLAFMYPRLLLARDLLSNDGVIFISIDDNELANLKLLCDEIFGEENFIGLFIINSSPSAIDYGHLGKTNDYCLFYCKNNLFVTTNHLEEKDKKFRYFDEQGGYNLYPLYNGNVAFNEKTRPTLVYPFYLNTKKSIGDFFEISLDKNEGDIEIYPVIGQKDGIQRVWRWGMDKSKNGLNDEIVGYKTGEGEYRIMQKSRLTTKVIRSLQLDNDVSSRRGTLEIEKIFNKKIFSYPKPSQLIQRFVSIGTDNDSFVLDFFAGSGTTGQAVMQLNAEDGGNRKFILCQIDEPIKEDKPAYKFCIDNNLPSVISSITIERLNRAGEKIKNEIEEANSKTGMFEEDKKQIPDIGYKVFNSVEAPKLNIDETGQIQFPELYTDAISRIYNMVFTLGLDEPTQVPVEVVRDCIYKIDNHYYITNSENISKDQFSECIKNGKVFVDGWTASLNATLQNYKEDVKIVF